MSDNLYNRTDVDIAWCPGCGNFSMHRILKEAFTELEFLPTELVLVSGIGQAAKLPHYINTHMFDGLHGRALPAALAIKAVNPSLKVVVFSGDGCSYGEGGNHFLHEILRSPGITQIVSNNMVYGLTKGQASPTSLKGFMTPVQVSGVTNKPFNPLSVAISLGATFVARIFAGDIDQSKDILKRALQHRGYALVDAFSQCVSFNRWNTFQWYKQNTYYLGEDHNPADLVAAFARAIESDPWPLGVFYDVEAGPTFEDQASPFKNNTDPLFNREVDMDKLQALIESKRGM